MRRIEDRVSRKLRACHGRSKPRFHGHIFPYCKKAHQNGASKCHDAAFYGQTFLLGKKKNQVYRLCSFFRQVDFKTDLQLFFKVEISIALLL